MDRVRAETGSRIVSNEGRQLQYISYNKGHSSSSETPISSCGFVRFFSLGFFYVEDAKGRDNQKMTR